MIDENEITQNGKFWGIEVLSENNFNAISVLLEACQSTWNPGDDIIRPTPIWQCLLQLNYLDITGSKIWKLYSQCCNQKIDCFIKTLDMLYWGVVFGTYTKEEIHNNLNLGRSIPYLDDLVQIDNESEKFKDDLIEFVNKLKYL